MAAALLPDGFFFFLFLTFTMMTLASCPPTPDFEYGCGLDVRGDSMCLCRFVSGGRKIVADCSDRTMLSHWPDFTDAELDRLTSLLLPPTRFCFLPAPPELSSVQVVCGGSVSLATSPVSTVADVVSSEAGEDDSYGHPNGATLGVSVGASLAAVVVLVAGTVGVLWKVSIIFETAFEKIIFHHSSCGNYNSTCI